MPLQEFIDSIHVPVVLVDSKVMIIGANTAAASYFHTKLSIIEGVKPGDVFECEYAALPEGCGRTIHCNGCVIRRTVKETWLTGESRVNVTACLNRKTHGASFQEKLSITTVKAGDAVLLKIEYLPAER
jgi:hypothetical protein